MVHSLQEFLSKPIVWITLSLALFFHLSTWGIIFLNFSPQDTLITLHYTMYFGVDKVGTWKEAFAIPLFGLIVLITNIGFAWYFDQKAKLIRNFFVVLTTIFSFLILLAMILVIIANLPVAI